VVPAGSMGVVVGVAGVVEAYRKAATEAAAVPDACDLHCEARSML
jgi:hypothetical protein